MPTQSVYLLTNYNSQAKVFNSARYRISGPPTHKLHLLTDILRMCLKGWVWACLGVKVLIEYNSPKCTRHREARELYAWQCALFPTYCIRIQPLFPNADKEIPEHQAGKRLTSGMRVSLARTSSNVQLQCSSQTVPGPQLPLSPSQTHILANHLIIFKLIIQFTEWLHIH